jgi:hypothetical protein
MCGSKAELISSEDIIINDFTKGYKIICSNIGCPNDSGWFKTEYQAISAWQDKNKSVPK